MKLFRIIGKVAATDSTVMVHGETGTGKELIARAIHLSSPRRGKPMIPVNCGAIPEELLETELFGHEKGAFTNAVKDRAGRFELAQGGTIFLDEIGDMSHKLQVKLLRVLQEHEFEKVGSDRTIRADIRVITATHVDLVKAVREGRFRQDLYYRLNVIPVSVPPLRERSEDIPLLVEYFLKRLRETRGSAVTGVSPSTMAQLRAYRWPGNIRELENLLERMVILADGVILTDEDLPAWVRTEPGPALEPADAGRDELLRGFLEPDEGQGEAPGPATGGVPGGAAAASPDPSPSPSPSPADPEGSAGETGEDGLEGEGSGESGESGEGQEGQESEDSREGQEDVFSGTDLADDPDGEDAPGDRPEDGGPQDAAGAAALSAAASVLPEDVLRFVSPILSFPPEGISLGALMKDYEGRLIEAALQVADGYRNAAARLLGVNRTTLQEKLRKK
jgi:transcriptional regulator with GAF, ATPase, and Fis domain